MAAAPLRPIAALTWLDDAGDIPSEPPARRRRALRMAQCIEYGGPLPRSHLVRTLIECRRRPYGVQCGGLLNVVKSDQDEIHAFCPSCHQDEMLIVDWQATRWADGPVPPIPVEELPLPGAADLPPAVYTDLVRAVGPHGITADEVVARIFQADQPTELIEWLASRCQPETERDLQQLLNVVMATWNATPRAELDMHTPDELFNRPARAEPRPGRNDPCPCGSGRKYEECCLH